MDDVVSSGSRSIRAAISLGAVINGPGLSDFCVRFIDENGDPVRDITVNLGSSGSNGDDSAVQSDF